MRQSAADVSAFAYVEEVTRGMMQSYRLPVSALYEPQWPREPYTPDERLSCVHCHGIVGRLSHAVIYREQRWCMGCFTSQVVGAPGRAAAPALPAAQERIVSEPGERWIEDLPEAE